MNDTLCYLDTSAFVKLVVDEPESEGLREFLIEWPQRSRVSSWTSRPIAWHCERTGPRWFGPSSSLRSLSLVPVSPEVRTVARSIRPPTLAIARRDPPRRHHDGLGADLGVFVAYDRRLLDAAADAGLAVASPS